MGVEVSCPRLKSNSATFGSSSIRSIAELTSEAGPTVFPELPVALTSGYSHVLAAEGSHGFELLQKPYTADGLARVLRSATTR
jgi:hypothetical protein